MNQWLAAGAIVVFVGLGLWAGVTQLQETARKAELRRKADTRFALKISRGERVIQTDADDGVTIITRREH